MTAPPLDAPMEFSEGATEQLQEALHVYLSTWEEVRHNTLRLALERLCTEAHAAHLGPERMLIAVKAAWRQVPGLSSVDRTRSNVAFSNVLSFCVAAYYAAEP